MPSGPGVNGEMKEDEEDEEDEEEDEEEEIQLVDSEGSDITASGRALSSSGGVGGGA